MKAWKAIASALLVLVGISGAASAQDWSHQDQRGAYGHNYQMQRDWNDNRDRARASNNWYNNERNGWYTQAPHRTRQNRYDGYYQRGDRDRGGDRR